MLRVKLPSMSVWRWCAAPLPSAASTPVHEQCDCGMEAHHAHHIVVAEHFVHALKAREFTQIRERIFAASDVDATSDPLALDWMD